MAALGASVPRRVLSAPCGEPCSLGGARGADGRTHLRELGPAATYLLRAARRRVASRNSRGFVARTGHMLGGIWSSIRQSRSFLPYAVSDAGV